MKESIKRPKGTIEHTHSQDKTGLRFGVEDGMIGITVLLQKERMDRSVDLICSNKRPFRSGIGGWCCS
jgi:hypothetical protein